MAFRVKVQPPALEEAEAAYVWLAERSPENAVRWYNGLVDAVRSLAEHPTRCPLAPENDAFPEEIRQLLYGKRHGIYRILFTIEGRTVSVLHIRHAAMEPLRPEEDNG